MADYSEEIEAVSNAIAAVYENKQNKKNDLSGDFSNDNDSYPSVKGLKNLLSTYVPSSDIGNLLSGKIDVSDIVDNLITNNASKVLSAKQGKVLKDLIDALVIPSKTSELVNDSGFLTSHQDISGKEDKSNKTSSWNDTTNNTRYPTEKLVKDSLDNKVDKETGKGLFSGSYSDLTNKPSIPSSSSDLSDGNSLVKTSPTTGLLKNDGSVMTSGTGSSNWAVGNHSHSGMLTTSDVANNLTTTTSGKVLDARQGKALADLIGDAITYINQ